MADKRKKLKKIDQENEKPTKEEYAIAKHLRFNCPVKDAKFVPMQNMVKCFYGNQAINTLLDSKWAKSTKSDIQFTDRKSCVYFLERLMVKGLFHRATKIERTKKDKDKLKKKKKDEEIEDDKEKKNKKDTKKIKDKDAKDSDADKPDTSDEKKVDEKEKKKDEPKKEEKKKKEKKLRLNMADEQRFIDAEEIYVWIYDPVPMSTFLIGLLMVLGAALLCVFPLWPDWLRVAVYYVSLVGASFVGFILFLAVVRGCLFCVLWVLTLGKVHLWILPNLTEDVGFFDSFKPLYTYKFMTKEDKENEKKKKEEKRKKKKKQEAGDSESEVNDKNEDQGEGQEEEGGEEEQNGDQEFEMVDREDLDEEQEEEGEEEQGKEGEETEEGEGDVTEEEDKKTK